MSGQVDNAQVSEATREQRLNEEIAKHVAHGYTVQSKMSGTAVLSRNKRMGWFWNTVLVLLTAGLWLIYVIYRALNRKTEVIQINVDVYGKVHIK